MKVLKWIKDNQKTAIVIGVVVLVIFFAGIKSAVAFDECLAGSWYEENGEGINIEVLSDERTVGYWYGYSRGQFSGSQRWYTFDMHNDIGPIYTTDSTRALHKVGTASLDLIDGSLLFVWSLTIDIDTPPWCIGCEGDLVLKRITGSCD